MDHKYANQMSENQEQEQELKVSNEVIQAQNNY